MIFVFLLIKMIRIILDKNILNKFIKLKENIANIYCYSRKNINNVIIISSPLLMYYLPDNFIKNFTIGFYGICIFEKFMLSLDKKNKGMEIAKSLISPTIGIISVTMSLVNISDLTNECIPVNLLVKCIPFIYLTIYGSLFIDNIKTLDKM